MAWLLFGAVAVLVVLPRFVRRRETFLISRSEPMSTLHGELAKKHAGKKRAALNAATQILR
jgi:hypothetical protein